MNDKLIGSAIGALFICAGLWVLFVYWYRSQNWIHAIGTVIAINEKQTRDDGRTTTIYAGTLAYHLPMSTDVLEFQDDVWRSPCAYTIGEEVPILINPRKPKQACVKHGKGRIFVSIGIIALGMIALFSVNKL